MVCEHVHMNISAPPPNYRACYGPDVYEHNRDRFMLVSLDVLYLSTNIEMPKKRFCLPLNKFSQNYKCLKQF